MATDSASVCSTSSSEADLGEFIGLSGGFTEDALGGFESEDDENNADNTAQAERDASRKRATPLYSLANVERLVLSGAGDQLKTLLDQVKAQPYVRDRMEAEDGTVLLQVEVLQMAVDLASGYFDKVVQSPIMQDVVAPEKIDKHGVSRVKNRIARYLHERVVEHIVDGLGPCSGSKSFRDPELSSPEVHVNQRVLRATACMFFGAACLNLFMQANWTGPPASPEFLEKSYPLPFLQGVYDTGGNDSNQGSEEGSAYLESAKERILSDAQAASLALGKEVGTENIDKFPELHARVALMMGANGENVYSDAKLLHYLHTARVILRIVANATLIPGAVDSMDMLKLAKIELELDDEDNKESEKKAVEKQAVDSKVRRALTHLCSASWWVARSATAHQETLEFQGHGAPSLMQEVERGMERSTNFLERMSVGEKSEDDADNLVARCWLEQGVMWHKFKQPERAKEAFAKAQAAAGLVVSLSGALGKRTKFQKDEKSQLIVLAASKSTVLKDSEEDKDEKKGITSSNQQSEEGAQAIAEQAIAPPEAPAEASQVVPSGTDPEEEAPVDNDWGINYGVETIRGIRKVKLEELDEHTPLHEEIQYSSAKDEEESRQRRGALSLLDQCIVLGLCMDVKNSYAMEALTAEEMQAYTERIVQRADNWQVYSTALLIKSQLEFERLKTKERAVLQMQALVDQQTDRLTPLQARQNDIDDAAPVSERFEWLNALAWPALWELKRGLASRYLDLGVAGSALKIFEEVKMWEEAVDCLVVMDKRARAEELIRARLEVQPTPNLMCVLGNLLQEEDWYAQAWELSNKRYARAKRMWAVHAFGKGDLQGSIDHLQDALKINPLYPGSWFRLGSAAMRLENWQLARVAFAHVCEQEPEEGDAWANLSSVLVQLEDYKAALKAVTAAVKYSRNNWKIWENYVALALQTSSWGMVISGLSSLIDLRIVRDKEAKSQVDVSALLLTIDAIITASKKLQDPNETLDRGTVDASGAASSAVSAELVAAWRTQLENLFEKIREKCRSDPDVWKAMSVYFQAFDMFTQARDCLLRRARALTHESAWERDEFKAKRIVKMVTDLHQVFSEHVKGQDASLDDSARAQVMIEATSLIQTVISHLEASPLEVTDLIEPLQALVA